MIRQKGIPISELVCRRFDEVRKGMRMNVTTEGRHQRVDTAVHVDDEIGQRTIAMNASVRLLLAEGGAEVQGDESPEDAVRKLHVGCMKLMCVSRPQRSTFDRYLHGSLSKADRTEPV